MIKSYTETIGRKVITYSYDTSLVKDICVDCSKSMPLHDRYNRYQKSGNYCPACNAKYGHKDNMKRFTKSV